MARVNSKKGVVAEKIGILFLAANPGDAGYRLRLDEEVREVEEKIQGGSKPDSFEVISQWAEKLSDLQKTLLRHSPHVVHFSGHGSKNKGITLEDRDGDVKPLSKQTLVELFSNLTDSIRVVFLNACQSSRQIDGFSQVIDFTIAVNSTTGDKTAVVFAQYFYQALAFGWSVPEAFELAQSELEVEGMDEAKTSELFVRRGIDVSEAYLIQTAEGDEANRDAGVEICRGIRNDPRSMSIRSVKGPAKPGSVSSAAVARAVRRVANRRARPRRFVTSEPHKSK